MGELAIGEGGDNHGGMGHNGEQGVEIVEGAFG